MELPLAHALDLAQHWILTETGISDDERKRITNEWTAPTREVRNERVPEEESWAPSWWQGDEDAAMSGRAAAIMMDAGKKGRRK